MDKLRVNLDFLTAIMDSSPNAVVVIDSKGVIKFLNKTLLKIFNYTEEEIKNKPVEILIPQRFREKHPALREKYFEKPNIRKMGGLSKNVLYGMKKDGTEFPLEIGLSPLLLDKDMFVLGSIIDISERHEIQMMNDMIINNSSDAIITANFRGKITSWNPGAQNIYGYNNNDIKGRSIEDLIIPSNKVFEYTQYLKRIKQGDSIVQFDTIRTLKNKQTIHVSIALSPLKDDKGDIIGALEISRDITAKKNEILLKEIHHRVKNNLAIITSMIQMESRRLESPTHEIVELLESTKNRILSISKIHERLYESKNFDQIEISIYLQELANDLINISLTNSDQSSEYIKLNLSRVNDEEVYLELDKSIPCGLICVEFVTNSIKHAFSNKNKENNEISIIINSRGEGEVEIIFSDNGSGISEEVFNYTKNKNKTLGLSIIELLSSQLEAKHQWDNSHGTELKINFKNEKDWSMN